MSARGYTSRYQFIVEWFRHINTISLNASEPKIAGKFRQDEIFGPELNRDRAPSLTEIKNATESSYPSVAPGKSIVTWRNTVCWNEIPFFDRFGISGGQRQINLNEIPTGGEPFADANGVQHHCGVYAYAQPGEVAAQLNRFGDDITSRMDLLLSGRGAGNASADPILIGAHAQRWFVSIHPFDGGNGRTSRFIMDFLVQSVGLPTPVLADMSKDLATPESAWALEVGKGMVRTVEIIESCARDRSQARCAEVRY
jgi:hypothetical protein